MIKLAFFSIFLLFFWKNVVYVIFRSQHIRYRFFLNKRKKKIGMKRIFSTGFMSELITKSRCNKMGDRKNLPPEFFLCLRFTLFFFLVCFLFFIVTAMYLIGKCVRGVILSILKVYFFIFLNKSFVCLFFYDHHHVCNLSSILLWILLYIRRINRSSKLINCWNFRLW